MYGSHVIPATKRKVCAALARYDPPLMPSPLRRALPNAITIARLGLAAVFFLLLQGIDRADQAESIAAVGAWAMALFIVAALSDILDGYLARRWGVVSVFGRLMDPLVDKILILGGFIYLASPIFAPNADYQMIGSGIAPWMVVVLLLREMLVSGIRALIESRGVAFPADWSGKAKMFVQSFCVGCCVFVATRIDPPAWMVYLRDGSTWATIVLTLLSSVTYIHRAIRMPTENRGTE
jgi:CDP-diacylglycerol--glycerol-3-phosphate 3-phosphatidyltransferase